jgi:hypothetical protein
MQQPRYDLIDGPTGRELVPAMVRPMRVEHRRAARARLVRGAAAAALVASLAIGTYACAPHARTFPVPTSTTVTDCHGPGDCGYGDNGINGDR